MHRGHGDITRDSRIGAQAPLAIDKPAVIADHPHPPQARVVVSSGDASVELARLPGALKLLSKPFPPSVLCEVIREVAANRS